VWHGHRCGDCGLEASQYTHPDGFSIIVLESASQHCRKCKLLFKWPIESTFDDKGRDWPGLGQGAQHSKEVYQMFKYIPGVKVVIPSSVQDAYSLLYESIFDNNPVVFFEHRWLYDIEGQLDTEADHRFLANNAVSYFKKFPADANIPEYCGWEVIEAMKSKKDFWDTKGNSYQCLLPPVPTARHLEDEWYKMRYGKEDIETYEHRFRGPF
jgi:hypothetical protein